MLQNQAGRRETEHFFPYILVFSVFFLFFFSVLFYFLYPKSQIKMKIMETIVGLLFWKESERKKTTDEKNRQKKKKVKLWNRNGKRFQHVWKLYINYASNVPTMNFQNTHTPSNVYMQYICPRFFVKYLSFRHHILNTSRSLIDLC